MTSDEFDKMQKGFSDAHRLHDIRESATRFLGDIIDPVVAVRPDPKRTSNFVEGHAEIVTPHNTYRMSVFTPQTTQPPGAPTECVSLGSVVFHDPINDVTIMGLRSDRTFLDISRHVHVREYTDGIAHARRELAEAGPEAIKPLQEKLGALVSTAGKWGVSGSVPMAPKAITEAVLWLRPHVTSGDGTTSLTASMFLRKTQIP
jgi:hypothetical protein